MENLQLKLTRAIVKRFGKCFDLSDRVDDIMALPAFKALQDELYTPWSGNPTFEQVMRSLDGFRLTSKQRIKVTWVCDLTLFDVIKGA